MTKTVTTVKHTKVVTTSTSISTLSIIYTVMILKSSPEKLKGESNEVLTMR